MNLNKNQQGIAHVLLALIVVAIFVAIGFVGWRVLHQNKKDQPNTGKDTTATKVVEEKDIALSNLGLLSLDDVLISKDALREYQSKGLKGFYVFGDALSGGRTNPNFEFSSLKQNTQVVASIDGIITHINQQPESQDMEVFLQPKEDSAWTIGYDHVTDLVVKEGLKVSAGDVIGKPAVQGNGASRFEIQINKDVNGSTTHYCPSTLLETSVKSSILASLTAMMNSWNSTSGLNLYSVDKQDPAGCLMKTLTPTQAEVSQP